ncbi:hypothetical protein IAQ61_000309 [Plenodomus lingam]|uniref:uncharacterized protein n=1 Tax=Leptosphaeria maculans TaxID=5022 RepID=UPI0033309747|nr:hypothetical protein IAQ61_000309 [Plenodomus lingam]
MTNHHDLSIRTRSASPTVSDTSDMNVLSTSHSPVSDYEIFLSQPSTPTFTVGPSTSRLREANGRFVPRGQASNFSSASRSPTMLPSTPYPSLRQMYRARAVQGNFPPAGAKSPAWTVGQGGFGTMDILPQEVRQMIFGLAFGSQRDNPVTVRTCCGPDTTEQIRDACRKHGIVAKRDAGRFNMLRVSKAMREEASWVVYYNTALLLDMNETMVPYMSRSHSSRSLRIAGNSLRTNERKSAFWLNAARFRCVHLRVPEDTAKWGVPVKFTRYLLQASMMFCKLWADVPSGNSGRTVRFVRIHLGSMFGEMLPYNMESQAAARYGELLDWLCTHSPTAEPDFDALASECTHNLHCMLDLAGKHQARYKWDVTVQTHLDRKDEDGLDELRRFQNRCEKNGVAIIR